MIVCLFVCVCPQPLIRVRGLLPLCGEVQLRAVVLYARHRRTEELHDASRGWSDPRIATTGVPRSEYDTIYPLVPLLFFLRLSARTQLSWSRRFSAFFRVLVFPSLEQIPALGFAVDRNNLSWVLDCVVASLGRRSVQFKARC